jgi:hypothetical protein
MMPTAIEVRACHNCGAELHGRFCGACGQEDRPLNPGMREVLHELAREISSLDGRIVRSVRRLFLSPGFLTSEHFQGRRVAWVSPVRLYLTFSVAYFAITAFLDASPLGISFRFTGDTDQETTQALREMGFASEQELQRAVHMAMATWMPRAMFVLVPVFGLLVSRVRRASGRKYPQHLIFALHVLAASFGVQAIAMMPGFIAGHPAVTALMAAASLLYTFAYMVIALRVVYGGTVRRALRDTVVVLFFYWLATVIVAAAIIVPVLFWRG